MDGVVVVERRSGGLHFTRSFTKHFDRRHPKSERMNLGALLFALQNFASNSFLSGHEENAAGNLPAIVVFETAAERIVLAQSVTHQLLFALFVRPSMDAYLARSVVHRIAIHYDRNYDLDAVLSRGAKLFRGACEMAIRDEVDRLLHQFGAARRLDSSATTNDALEAGFILFYVAPSTDFRRRQWTATADGAAGSTPEDSEEDDGVAVDDDAIATAAAAGGGNVLSSAKESRIASPSVTSSHRAVPHARHRLHQLYACTHSLLYRNGRRRGAPKKNAVMHYADPTSFQQLLQLPASRGSHGDDPLASALQHPRFAQALVVALQPSLEAIADLMHVPEATEVTWRGFPLPKLHTDATASAPTIAKPIVVDLRIWTRNGCVFVYTDNRLSVQHVNKHERAQILQLLDKIEPMAHCAINLAS